MAFLPQRGTKAQRDANQKAQALVWWNGSDGVMVGIGTKGFSRTSLGHQTIVAGLDETVATNETN
jgi:hypothetical protein